MKNLSIKRRLILAFAATILLCLISVGVAEIGTWSTGDKYQEVLDNNVASDAALLTARINVNTAARYIRDMALTGYNTADEAVINSNLAELKNVLALFNSTYAVGDGKAAEYTKQVEAWMVVVPKIVAEMKAGNSITAIEMIKTQCTPALDVQSTTAAALTQASNQLTEEHVNTAHTIFIVSMCVVIGLAVLSLIFVITMAGRLILDITVPLDQAEHAMEDMSRGDFSRELNYVANNEIGRMIEALRVSRRVLEGVVSDVDHVTDEMANGNFNVELTAEFPGSLSSIADSVTHLVERMNDTLGNIAQAADQVAQGADQMADNAQSMAQGAAEQASSVEELSAAINSISDSARSNTALAKGSMNSAIAAGGQVDVCSGFMKELVVAMNGISKSSEQIGNIISTIENIAFQTNILALNAAVEAARAGAAGKGFAVVADEVRNLASKSDEAAKATKELIENSIKAVEGGNRLVKDANGALEETVGLAGKAVGGMGEVAQAVMAETEAITEVTNGITQISNVVQTNSATAEESAAASQELSGQADLMHTLLSGFRLRGGPSRAPRTSAPEGYSPPVSMTPGSKY